MVTANYHNELGASAEMVLAYIKNHDDTNSPIFGDRAVTDILNLVCEESDDIADPKVAVIYGIYFGLSLME